MVDLGENKKEIKEKDYKIGFDLTPRQLHTHPTNHSRKDLIKHHMPKFQKKLYFQNLHSLVSGVHYNYYNIFIMKNKMEN